MNFTTNDLPSKIIENMKQKNIWVAECPVKLEQLKLLELVHFNFNEEIKTGQMVVFGGMAEKTINVFKELFDLKFPINQIKLIDEYDGNDELSMTDNNSSCFNYRKITGSDIISIHSYGLAIDINPVQNPYLVIDKKNCSIEVFPKEGINFLNRHNQRPGMVEPIINIFKKYGFDVWGGYWNDPIDYHHFQVDRKVAEQICTQ